MVVVGGPARARARTWRPESHTGALLGQQCLPSSQLDAFSRGQQSCLHCSARAGKGGRWQAVTHSTRIATLPLPLPVLAQAVRLLRPAHTLAP